MYREKVFDVVNVRGLCGCRELVCVWTKMCVGMNTGRLYVMCEHSNIVCGHRKLVCVRILLYKRERKIV